MSLRSVFSMLALIAVLVPAELPAAQHLPNAMGKVNILENGRQRVLPLSGHQEAGSVRAAWDVLPGWPVTVPASGEEGGILVELDGDSDLELVSTAGTTISAHNPDGTTVTGWPRTTVNTIGGAAAAGDIDGDGDLEIVVNTWSYSSAGQIVAWELDGTLVAGFPVDNGYAMRSVTLADLDGNGTMEIISNTRLYPVGEVTVYRGDGSIYPGWPQPITHVPAGSAAAGDIDGDGDPEVIGMSYDALFAWHHDGTAVSGFPFTLPVSITVSYSSPVLADIDGDGLREIVFGACHESGGTSPVYVLNGDGTVLPGWPQVHAVLELCPAGGLRPGWRRRPRRGVRGPGAQRQRAGGPALCLGRLGHTAGRIPGDQH